MLSYTERRTLFGNLSNNTSSATLSLADTLINNAEKEILSSRQWSFLESLYTLSTVASTQFITLPMYIDRVSSCYVTVGTTRWTPRECPSRQMWDRLNVTTITSDIPQWFYVYNGQLGLYPVPATAGNTITINSKQLAKDLSVADYTAGSITTIVTSGTTTTITGTGTTWTSKMVGRYIRVTDSDTVKTGDGFWYQIASVPSTTTLTLTRTYGGAAISTATAAYTISQCSLIPEQYQILPIYRALEVFFTSVDPDATKAQLYKKLGDDMFKTLESDYTVKNTDCVIDDGRGFPYPVNPNNYIQL